MNWSLSLINRSGQRVSAPFSEARELMAHGFQLPAIRQATTVPEGESVATLLDLTGCGLGDCVAALPAATWLSSSERPLWISCPVKAAFLFKDLACRVMIEAPASGWSERLDAEAALEQAMYASLRPLSGLVSYNPVEVLCELAGCAPALPSHRPAPELEGRAVCELTKRHPDRHTVVIQVHSASREKDWPELRWEHLRAGLEAEGCGVCFSSEPETVESLAALLAVADLVVGPDSLCFHLAAAVGTPAIGLFGPTDGAAMARWYPQARAIQVHDLAALPVSTVLAACLEEIGNE